MKIKVVILFLSFLVSFSLFGQDVKTTANWLNKSVINTLDEAAINTLNKNGFSDERHVRFIFENCKITSQWISREDSFLGLGLSILKLDETKKKMSIYPKFMSLYGGYALTIDLRPQHCKYQNTMETAKTKSVSDLMQIMDFKNCGNLSKLFNTMVIFKSHDLAKQAVKKLIFLDQSCKKEFNR